MVIPKTGKWSSREFRASYFKEYEKKRDRKRVSEISRATYARDIVRQRERCKAKNRKAREEVLKHYGGACECCGENKYEFLTLDHKNNDGAEHRRKIGGGGVRLAHWLRANGLPDIVRVLCWNCHMAITHHKFCPCKVNK